MQIKRITKILIILCLFLVVIPGVAQAETMYEGNNMLPYEVDDPIPSSMFDSKFLDNEALKVVEERASFGERFVAEIIVSLPNWIMQVVGLDDPITLIFNMPPEWIYEEADKRCKEAQAALKQIEDQWDQYSDYAIEAKIYAEMELRKYQKERMEALELLEGHKTQNKYLYIFSEKEFSGIALLFHTINEMLPFPLVIALLLVGFQIMQSVTFSGGERTGFKMFFEGFILFIFLTKSAVFIWGLVFKLNNIVVALIASAVSDRLSGGFLNALYYPGARSLGTAIVTAFSISMIGVLNWQYILRKITIAVLIILYPVMSMLVIFPGKKQAWESWKNLFIQTVFLQAAHALAFGFFMIFMQENNGTRQGFLITLVCLFSITTIANLVQKVVGGDEGGKGIMGAAGTAMGAASMMALYKVGSSALNGARTSIIGGSPSSSEGVEKSVTNATGGSNNTPSNVSTTNPSLGRAIGQYALTKGKAIASKGARASMAGTAMTFGTIAGSMISGAVTGNSQGGLAFGGMGGYLAYEKMSSLPGDIGSAYNNAYTYLHPAESYIESQGADIEKVSGLDRKQTSSIATSLQGYVNSNNEVIHTTQTKIDHLKPDLEYHNARVTAEKIQKEGETKENYHQRVTAAKHALDATKAKEARYKQEQASARMKLRKTQIDAFVQEKARGYLNPPRGGSIN